MFTAFYACVMQEARNEIFAMRPAPIQVSYMGFPRTTGAHYIDYLVTDEVFSLQLMRTICHCWREYRLGCFVVSSSHWNGWVLEQVELFLYSEVTIVLLLCRLFLLLTMLIFIRRN